LIKFNQAYHVKYSIQSSGDFSLAVLVSCLVLLGIGSAYAQLNPNSETKRFIRGVDDNSTVLKSFVIPLDFQKGVELDDMGDNAAKFPDDTPWFIQVPREQRYHFGLVDSGNGLVPDYEATPFENPIVAFGSGAGGTHLYTDRTYRFGVNAGPMIQIGNENPHAYKIWITAYRKSDLAQMPTDYIVLPRRNATATAEKAKWDSYVNNGYVWPTPEYPRSDYYGLTTRVEYVEGGIDAGGWDLGAEPFFRSGEATYQGYILTHSSNNDDYFYKVEGYSAFPVNTDQGPAYYPMAGTITPGNPPPPTIAPTTLYAINFDERPAWRTTDVDRPQFQAEPMPSQYAGKNFEELLNAQTTVTQTVSGTPSSYTTLDHSAELRQHPALDQLAADLTGTLGLDAEKAVAIANYVLNEIGLADPINYNETGDISEASINPGGMSRGALAVYQEAQGSPAEQCALLVYLLREAGIPATYLFPEQNKLKMLDVRMSHILGFQIKGAVDNQGETEEPFDPLAPSLIPVNYPWVAAHIDGQWVHLFPWIKDHEIIEGYNLYDFMPEGYKNGHQWLDQYFNEDNDILSLSTEDPSPANLFPKFISDTLAQNHPELSIDDMGVSVRQRKTYFSRLEDFPQPFELTGTPATVERLQDRMDLFDTVQISVYSQQNPGKKLETATMPLMAFHNRKLLLRQTKVNATTHSFHLTLSPFRPGTSGTGAFTETTTIPVEEQQLAGSSNLDASDTGLAIEVTVNRHQRFHNSFTVPEDRWNTFLGYTADSSTENAISINKGDMAALCLNVGRVSPKMLAVHAEEFWRMEQDAVANPSSQDPDVYQGTAAYLMGMAYYNKVDTFTRQNAQLHKRYIVGNYAMGLAVLRAEYVGGQLPNGDITYVQPLVDMFFQHVGLIGNETIRPDSGMENIPARKDFQAINIAAGSAMEHQIINTYFDMGDSISTVELLRIAKADPVTYPNGFYELTINNYLTYDTAMTAHDPTLWAEVKSYFEVPDFGKYVKAYITSEPVTGASGAYEGMGALVFSFNSWAALISRNLNGGAGSFFSTSSAFQNSNVSNLSLSYSPSSTFAPTYSLSYTAPSVSSPVIAAPISTAWDYSSNFSNIASGSAIVSSYQNTSWSQITSSLGYTPSGSGNAALADSYSYINDTGYAGGSSWWGNITNTISNIGTGISDPVNAITGEFYEDKTDLQLNGPMSLFIRRNYQSGNIAENEFGYGWRWAYFPYLVVGENEEVIHAAEMDGSVIVYRKQSATLWEPEIADNPHMVNSRGEAIGSVSNMFNASITKSTPGADTIYTLTGPDGSERVFKVDSFPTGGPNGVSRERPYLEKWTDNRGNFYTFDFEDDSTRTGYGKVRRIESSNGNFIGLYYNTFGYITEAYSGDGRRVKYRYDEFGDLREVTRPDNSWVRYEYEHDTETVGSGQEIYSTHRITRVVKPDGRSVENSYDSQGRVDEQWSTAGEDLVPVLTAKFIYSHTENPDGSLTGTTTIQDALHTAGTPRETVYSYTASQITSVVDAEGNQITQSWYDPSDTSPGAYPRSLEYRIDERNLRSDYAYDSFGNLETVTLTGDITGDGSSDVATTQTTYNSLNLPKVVTDAVNNVTEYFYENTDYPYLSTKVEYRTASGLIHQTVNTYHAMVDGTSHSSSPPATPTGRGAYGLLKQTALAQGSSDEAVTIWTHDDRGFITSQTSQTGTSDPDVVVNFDYNYRGEMVESQDAANRTTTYAYDDMGRKTWEERRDASGILVWWNYDYYNFHGELEWSDGPRYHGSSSGAEDYVWRKYDGMGRLTEESFWRSEARSDGSGVQPAGGDGLYATTFHKYNAFGDRLESRDPNQHLTKMAYDKVGRMTDRWFYDGPSDSDTLLAHEQFEYEPGDKVSVHTNPKGGETNYFYTATGQIRRQENPDDTVLEWRYQLDGRVTREPINHNLYWDISYDDLNRTVTKVLTAVSGGAIATRTETYDRRGNLVEWNDVENHTFICAYDGLNRKKSETGPAATASSAQQTTTYTYDAAGVTLTVANGLNEQTVTTYDAIGRVGQIDVKDASGTTQRTTSFVYSPDHHSVGKTVGTGGEAITTTTFTDTFGHTVLTAYADGTFTLRAYDPVGNLESVTDELGKTTSYTYDGLNRMRFQTLPDTAQIELRYDSGSNLTHRIMPAPTGSSTYQWEALYDSANRMTSQELSDGSSSTRDYSYTYYGSGDFKAGLLNTSTDPRGIVTTHTYDDFRRVQSATLAGSSPEHNITTTYGYDHRSLLTSVTQTHSDYSTLVSMGYDGYGQLTSETASIDSEIHSDMAQQWDAAGRRESLVPASAPSPFTYQYWPDGLMKQASFNSQNYGFAFGDNGLLTARNNPFRDVTITQRDSRGRIESQATSVNGTTVLTETLQWQDNSRLDDYTVTRTTLGGNPPPLPNEYRDYTYNNDRGRLTSETYGPIGSQSTINYEFDDGNTAGLGIRTQAQLTGGGYLVDASTVNAFARTTLESTDAEPKTFTATGNAFGAGEVELTLLSSTSVVADFPGWEDATGDWSADLALPAGSFTLKAEAIHPSGWKAPSDTNNFTVQATTENLTSAHDADGNTTTRSFSASGRAQTLTWDGLGRLRKVEERNGSNDGYDWSAKYDGLNRRLATSYQKITANLPSPGSHLLTTQSFYDPQVEFLEIGLTVNRELTTDDSYWKIYGPDLNESFGGLQGIGGLEAIYDGDGTTGIISDSFGHAIARSEDGLSLIWSDSSISGYGPLPGSWASSIRQSGDLSISVSWQGRYVDPTGYFCVGARYYEPNSGRFISADPLGHEASMDLYSYASGDPINMADPDGRFASGIYNGVGNNGNIGISSPSSNSFYTGNIIGAAFGGYAQGLGQGAQNVSGYTRYQEHLTMFDGDVYNAANAAWNPAYLAATGFYQAGTGTGLAPSNIGTQLDWVGRGIAGAEGVLGTVGTVGLAATATHFGSSTVGAFRQGHSSSRGNAGLIHLTDDAGYAGINQSQSLIGNRGIFAVPETVASESTALKVLRTGLDPAKTQNFVKVPDSATGLFQRPLPVGPYSAWKYFGGVRYGPAGSINTATGAFSPASTLFGPRSLIYGPDALFYGGAAASGGYYLSGEEE